MGRSRKTLDAAPFDFGRSLQKLQPESFFQFARQYPDPNGCSVYIYRLKPAIDRRQAGVEDTNIEVLANPSQLDEEYILRTHGSGKYHLKFTDANKPKGLTEVAKTTVEVFDPAVPAILNPVELVIGAPGNDTLVNKYLSEGWTVIENRLTPPANKGQEVLAETVRDLLKEQRKPAAEVEGLAGRLVELLERKSSDGFSDIERSFALLEKLRPSMDPVQVELLKVVASMNRPAASASNPLAELRQTAEFLKEMGWGGGADKGGHWTDAVTALPGILQYGVLLVRELRTTQASGVQPGAAPASRPAPAAAPGLPAGEAAPSAGADPAAGENSEVETMLGGVSLSDLKGLFDDAVDAFGRGIGGADFAHAVVCRRNGERLYEMVCAMGKDHLIGMLGTFPEGQALQGRRAEVEAWLDKFIEYGEPEESEPPAPEQRAS